MPVAKFTARKTVAIRKDLPQPARRASRGASSWRATGPRPPNICVVPQKSAKTRIKVCLNPSASEPARSTQPDFVVFDSGDKEWSYEQDLEPADAILLDQIARRLRSPYAVVYETPDHEWVVQMVPEGSLLCHDLDRLTLTGRLDITKACLARDGPSNERSLRILAVNGLEDGTPFGVERGVLRSERCMTERISNASLKNLHTTRIPAYALELLARKVGFQAHRFQDLVLDSTEVSNEITHLKDVEHILRDCGHRNPNCGPFLIFDKSRSKPFICYFTKGRVKRHEEIHIYWETAIWRVIAETHLKAIAETAHWYHVYLKRTSRALRSLDINIAVMCAQKKPVLRTAQEKLATAVLYFDTSSRGPYGVCDFTTAKEAEDEGKSSQNARRDAHPLGNTDYLHDQPKHVRKIMMPVRSFFSSASLIYSASCSPEVYFSRLGSKTGTGRACREGLKLVDTKKNAGLVPAEQPVINLLQFPEGGPTAVASILDSFCPPRWIAPPSREAYCLIAATNIKKGQPIEVYCGQLRDRDELRESDEEAERYAYDIDMEELRKAGYPSDAPDLVVENGTIGNKARFVNDEFLRPGSSNCRAELRWHEQYRVPIVVFFAIKEIRAGREIITDYDAMQDRRYSTYWQVMWKRLLRDMQEYWTKVAPLIEQFETELKQRGQNLTELKPTLGSEFELFESTSEIYSIIEEIYKVE